MFISAKKIWIAFLTLFALSITSVAGYIPSSSAAEHSLFEPVVTAQVHFSDDHCVGEITPEDDSASSEHQCCSNACPSSFPVSASEHHVITPPSRLALMPTEVATKSDSFNSALFKPPIG